MPGDELAGRYCQPPMSCVQLAMPDAVKSRPVGIWRFSVSHVPMNIGRPEQCSVALCAQVGVARKNESALLFYVAAKPVIDRSRVHQGIDVVVLRARSDVEVRAVWGQIGFSLIGPEGIEAFADDVVAKNVPVPASGFGIAGVDVRAGAVIR